MPNESQPVGGEIQLNPADTQVEKPETSSGGTDSPSAPVQDNSGEIQSMRAQLERMREDLDRERETSRLLQSYVSNREVPKQRDQFDDDYKDVDKTLGPWLDRKLKPYIDNLSKVLTEHYDRIDELSFTRDLIQSDPELAEKLNPGIPIDEIDRYRMRIAQSEGRYIKRSDALGILRGMKSIKDEKLSKAGKKQRAAVDESVRQVAVEVTKSGEDKPELKSSGSNPKVEAALKKLRSHLPLTDEERSLARKHLEDVEL